VRIAQINKMTNFHDYFRHSDQFFEKCTKVNAKLRLSNLTWKIGMNSLEMCYKEDIMAQNVH